MVQEKLGIMFDMDNTLLQSKIPFKKMRADLISFLVDCGLGRDQDYAHEVTAAQVIAKGKQLNRMRHQDPDIEKQIWEIATKHEEVGMQDVRLERGVAEGLERLKQNGYVLTVVTNNAYSAARRALANTMINSYFDLIVGREQMQELKPSPSGLVHIITHYEQEVGRWVMLGDSWIDGKAAHRAKVDFVSYKGEEHKMKEQGVFPLHTVWTFSDFVDWIETERGDFVIP